MHCQVPVGHEYTEEHAVEDGLLSGAMDDGKVIKSLAISRLKEAKRERSDPDEVKALERLLELYSEESSAKKAVKDAQSALDLATLRKYGELNEADIQQLVLEDKWRASIAGGVGSEVNALTLALVVRILELGDRYAETVDELDEQLQNLEAKVSAHLADMGVE